MCLCNVELGAQPLPEEVTAAQAAAAVPPRVRGRRILRGLRARHAVSRANGILAAPLDFVFGRSWDTHAGRWGLRLGCGF